MDGDFGKAKIAAQDLHLGLKEVRARLDAAIEDHLQSVAREELKPAGHVGELRAEQQVGEQRAAAAHDAALERAVGDGAAVTEARPKDAIVSIAEASEEFRDVARLMAESA